MATNCVAQSTHVAVGTGIDTYLWTVDPVFTIVSGQGTDTIIISSTSNADVTGDISCDGTNAGGTDSFTASVTHAHTFVDPIVDLTPGLVAHYLLNNNADDSHGTYDGTPSGGVDFQGDIASFDGVDDYIDSGYKTSNSSNTYTISAWVSRNSINTIDCLYGEIDLTSNSYGAYISFSSDGVSLAVSHFKAIQSNSDEIKVDISSYINSMSDMNHVVFTRENNVNHKLYVNGTLVGTASCANVVATSSFDGSIGDAVNSDPRPFDGKISNFRIYSDAKDQTFIDDLYAEGYYPKPLTEPTTVGLIAHYPLTGTAEDSTGNYDGTEISMSYVDDSEFGSVASFDGTGYIERVSVSALTEFSFSVWFRTSDIASNMALIELGDKSVISANNKLFYVADTLYISCNDGGGGYASTSALGLDDDKWHFLYASVIENGQITLSIDDGTPVLGTSTATLISTNELRFGSAGDGTGGVESFFNGELRNPRIYNRVLTAQEITDIYNYEKNFRPIDINDGLVAYYPLANNSLDNYYNEYNGADTAMTYNGDGAVFNGTTSNVITSLDVGSFGEITVSIWLKASSTRTYDGYAGVVSSLDSTADGYGGFAIQQKNQSVFRFFGFGNNLNNIEFTPTPDIYQHIACKWDGLIMSVYIDGVFHDSLVTLTNTLSNLHTVEFGKLTDHSLFSGVDIKNTRIYNKALTIEQIEIIYNEEYVAPPPIDLETNLVAHYLLNNNADDVAGTYDGTPNGNLFTGDVSTFDGTDDYIHISDYDSGRLDTTVTVSAWYRPDTIGNADNDVIYNNMLVSSGGGNTANSGFIIALDANGHFYIVYNVLNNEAYANDDGESATSYSITNKANSHTAVAGQLYHIVGTVNNNVSKLYIDGILACTVTTTQSMRYATALQTRPSITIGSLYYADLSSTYNEADGDISNIRVYSDVKTQTDITALYAEGYYPKPLIKPTTTGLIAHYPLTGTAEDTTGNYDGTEVGVTYVDDVERGSVLKTTGSNLTPSHASSSTPTRTNSQQTTITMNIRVNSNNLSSPINIIWLGSAVIDRMYVGASITNMKIGVGYGEKQNVTLDTGIPFTFNEMMHVAVEFDNGTVRLYKNNILGFTDTYTPSSNAQKLLTIGTYWSELNGWYDNSTSPNANISSTRFYDGILTTTERTDIYNYENNFRSIDIDDGLIAYYPLANNSDDNYYNEYDGTDTDITYDGENASFDGVDGRIDLPSTDYGNSLSFSAFVTHNSNGTYCIFATDSSLGETPSPYVRFYIDVNVLTLKVGSNDSNVLASTAITSGTLNHVAFTISGTGTSSTIKIYLNGVSTTSSGTHTSINSFTPYNSLGYLHYKHSDSTFLWFMDGEISNTRIYNKALTPEQIEVIYNEESIV